MQKPVELIIKELALKYGLTELDVENMVKAVFKTTVNSFKSADIPTANYKNVRIRKIGLFYVKEWAREKIRQNSDVILKYKEEYGKKVREWRSRHTKDN